MEHATLLNCNPQTKAEFIQLLDLAIEYADRLHFELDCIDAILAEEHRQAA